MDSEIQQLETRMDRHPKRVQIEPLRDVYFDSAMKMAVQIFSGEQNIPRHLVPLSENKNPKWWCARVGEEVIATAAAWEESGQWHWGRFAVDKNFRGLGIGKALAVASITALFSSVTNNIIIEARDITIGILEKFGAKQTNRSFDFFGSPVTPMELGKEAFMMNLKKLNFRPQRMTRKYRQTINAGPEQVFALLCPVKEAEWLDGWKYQMIYSVSGLVEEGAVFRTPGEGEADTFWVVTQHDARDLKVEFTRFTPDSRTCVLKIAVRPKDESTSYVDVSYTYTGLSPAGNHFIENFTEEAFLSAVIFWEKSMNFFLKTGQKLEKA